MSKNKKKIEKLEYCYQLIEIVFNYINATD